MFCSVRSLLDGVRSSASDCIQVCRCAETFRACPRFCTLKRNIRLDLPVPLAPSTNRVFSDIQSKRGALGPPPSEISGRTSHSPLVSSALEARAQGRAGGHLQGAPPADSHHAGLSLSNVSSVAGNLSRRPITVSNVVRHELALVRRLFGTSSPASSVASRLRHGAS